MEGLKGKVALVTGGTRGIGLAISRRLADEGVKVFMTYRDNHSAARQACETISQAGGEAVAHALDVTDRQALRDLLETIDAETAGVDILVNNAGINNPTDFDQISDEDWDEIMRVNLKGPFVCTQEVLPYMRKRGGGAIVNIGSVSGQYGGPRTAHYAASKAGLISLGQVIARFGAGDKIRCNTVAGGLIASEMGEAGLQAASVAKAAEGILLGRLGSADEVARVVAFLASDEASYITAQTINVNGGLYF